MAATDDPEAIRKAKDKSKRDEAGRHNVIKGIMGTVHGRKWFYEVLEMCHIHGISGDPNMSGDGMAMALRTYFFEGERNIGNRLLADIQSCAPAEYLRMMREAKDNEAD